uniref:Uncharacterized protein n=1 Tax=Arundo donax TaxID=35708 RepID=A0A0A8Y0C2_ARUDO
MLRLRLSGMEHLSMCAKLYTEYLDVMTWPSLLTTMTSGSRPDSTMLASTAAASVLEPMGSSSIFWMKSSSIMTGTAPASTSVLPLGWWEEIWTRTSSAALRIAVLPLRTILMRISDALPAMFMVISCFWTSSPR